MSLRTMALLTILCLAVWFAAGDSSSKEPRMIQTNRTANTTQSRAAPGAHARAKAKVIVRNSQADPYEKGERPALVEIHLNESFTGDMDGESTVRALEVQRDNRSASLVSMQRFRGKIAGRQGTFVLQGSEIVENGAIKATWFVVPGSGTGGLFGLRGQGGFQGNFGKASTATLDYWFERTSRAVAHAR